MLFKSFLLSAALLVSSAVAATTSLNATITSTTSIDVASGCSFSRTLTVTAQADLDSISSCEAIRGDVLIEGDELTSANIATVKAVYGDLTFRNCSNLETISASELTTVTGTLSLTQLYILSTVNVQALTSVGAVNFVTLPALSSINFGTGITDAESIYISDTELESLNGFSVTDVQVFNVNNNRNLNSIDSQLQQVSSALEVSYNSNDLEATFDQLIWANNITLRDISSISFANLTRVNASFGVITTEIDSLEVEGLESVGGTFIISNNEDLTDLSFPSLTSVGGGFVVTNNSDLHNITGFGSLRTIGGAVNMNGDIDEASFSSLRTVRGGFVVESDGDLNCRAFNSLDRRGVIQGDRYICRGASTTRSSSGTRSHTSSSSSSRSSSTSSGSESSSSSSASATAASSASGSSSSSAAGVSIQSGVSLFTSLAAVLLGML